ncbi:MAG TPA: hypothetical protein VN706_24750 [Gemmatimonadaceae bacterium]|nr:hypothetical protein [Gemmatimonadaceae bacterium]
MVELLITIVLVGILASVATLAVRRYTPPPNAPATVLADSLPMVVRTGRALTVQFTVGGSVAMATLNPDGSVVADSALHVDRLTGHSADAR